MSPQIGGQAIVAEGKNIGSEGIAHEGDASGPPALAIGRHRAGKIPAEFGGSPSFPEIAQAVPADDGIAPVMQRRSDLSVDIAPASIAREHDREGGAGR